jgi:hypothetical protein
VCCAARPGFTPWLFKYVDAKHGGVPTEWTTAQILTQYNCYLDADACCVQGMANAAFFSNFPLSDRYVQRPPPSMSQLVAAGLMNADGTVAPLNFVSYYGTLVPHQPWSYGTGVALVIAIALLLLLLVLGIVVTIATVATMTVRRCCQFVAAALPSRSRLEFVPVRSR